MIGQNFLPLDETYCKIVFPDVVRDFVGYYVNNYTIACDVPMP